MVERGRTSVTEKGWDEEDRLERVLVGVTTVGAVWHSLAGVWPHS